ncbi:MAG: alpha-2-macroglobulin, partial [Bacteroidetes bacterium]|nr:alpha-2-macroglobulin [Bacteroidota bacterium]
NRTTGQPLANASVQRWEREYNYTTRKYKKESKGLGTTDKNGFIRFAVSDNGRNSNANYFDIRYQDDRLFMDETIYTPYRYTTDNGKDLPDAEYEKKYSTAYVFIDRGIYRPGQTVYFKGIAITRDRHSGKNKLVTQTPVKVYLMNATYQQVDSVQLTSSDYGSFSGSFRLPTTGLTGNFTLNTSIGNPYTFFRVEEYKRPKFFVEFEKTKGSYRLGDSITVKGFAKAFAGNSIDGAEVKYRVERNKEFLYPWMFKGIIRPQGGSMAIADGVVKTMPDGSFTIRFKAITDAQTGKAFDPVYNFTVTTDITDLNGETQSGSQIVRVSDKALVVKINLPQAEQPVATDSFRTFTVATENLARTFEPSLLNISISRLQSPNRLIRNRYWDKPDQYVMTEAEYLQNFPLDTYANEDDYHFWPKAETVWQTTDSSGEQKSFRLPQSLKEGWYVVEASAKDKYGATVKDIGYVQIYENTKTPGIPSWLTVAQPQAVSQPGDHTPLIVSSSAGKLFLIRQTNKSTAWKEMNCTYDFLTLDNERRTFDFPIQEQDRGGFEVTHLFVKDNRFYSKVNGIQVPWTNKELNISYRSFRDKTLPGSPEQWTLTVSGSKKDPAAAEMVAAMYDASLDQYNPIYWTIPYIWPTYSPATAWSGNQCFRQASAVVRQTDNPEPLTTYAKTYDELMSFLDMKDDPFPYFITGVRPSIRYVTIRGSSQALAPMQYSTSANAGLQRDMSPDIRHKKGEEFAKYPEANGMAASPGNRDQASSEQAAEPTPQIRRNFNETAFFLPDLKTDSAGNISFSFTMPEALTRWKFQGLAHTKELAFGYTTKEIVTQKPLMVQPNAPRFLREGDKMELSAKVSNLTDKELTGTVQLELFNAATNQPADGWFRNMYPVQYFTAEAGQSAAVRFSIDVPYQYNSALVYRFVAKAGDNSDGEEASLPVLTNSMLVTESMPLPMRGNSSRNFKFEKLLQSGSSETLQQHALTVEFTTNPAWYAVQALPYLTDYPYECAEQTFNRYYANALAGMIARVTPKLKAMLDTWNTKDTAALLSNLEKNQELKAVLLEETPWVMTAKSESQQKKNIALLFDMVRMQNALSSAFEKLRQMQSSNGGFVWFKGGSDNRYITQYILAGIGHLKKLKALDKAQQDQWKSLIKAGIDYADKRIREDYDYLIKHKVKLDQDNLGYNQVQYLYLRSFFNDYDIPGASFTAVNYYRKQSQQYWVKQSRYMQGMIALSLFRTGDIKTANDILRSLKENAIVNDEMGMYWKDNAAGYFWYQSPIEAQSLLIETFSEIGKDTRTVDDLKTWLLKQKQVQDWKTTRATAEACYALLLQGSDWLSSTPEVNIKLGDKTISSSEEKQEAGTGYFKKTIDGPFVHPSMGDISVRVATTPGSSQSSWGAVYWQYFEHLDKITPAATPLKLSKKLFVQKNTDRGPVLEPVAENAYLKVGDKIIVRIELRSDRDLEYVHMKDMRASCMEPVNVLSSYKWQGGLGYYESTRDASTNFFFDWLPKGTYVFEYPLFVTHTGNFSNGVTSIQCMYAPEFSAHSEGVRVNVE